MTACVISDKDYQTETFQRLQTLVQHILNERQMDITDMKLGWEDLKPCMGCFGCWTKKPGVCVINDAMSDLNRTTMASDTVIYLSPIIFGQFSANIKNALDRWIPNILPFFEIRSDGSTMHPSRYRTNPAMIMIGYGDAVSSTDARLFADITLKHRHAPKVVIYNGDDRQLTDELAATGMNRMGAEL